MAVSGEQDMVFDSEGDQNSVDSFEKQLQQQEQELQNQLREQEQEALKASAQAEASSEATAAAAMLPAEAPTAIWKVSSININISLIVLAVLKILFMGLSFHMIVAFFICAIVFQLFAVHSFHKLYQSTYSVNSHPVMIIWSN